MPRTDATTTDQRRASPWILVVDDDGPARRQTATVLHRAGHPTTEADTGEEALALAHRSRPALVLSEVLLPVTSGYEVCRALKERYGRELPVVLMSAQRTHPADHAAALIIGADDSIAKPAHPDELLARVRRLLRPPVASDGARPLTPREREVLTLLAAGFSQADIADRLVITARTVSKHVEHILPKLGAHTRAQAVAVALRHPTLVQGLPAPDLPVSAPAFR